jgi:D-arginine dehydrogenase
MERFDFVVIGAGAAGASAGYELANHGRVVVLEREEQPGYHSTGRSAAMFTEAYGSEILRGLTCAGRSFFENPPDGFTDTPLLSPRGMMYIGRADQAEALTTFYEASRRQVSTMARLDAAESRALVPLLRDDYVAGAVLEPQSDEIDVAALHQGYLRGLRARGGQAVTEAEVTALSRVGDLWQVETVAGGFTAPIVINAAGAWCDIVASRAGARTIGLQPKRRTAFIFDAPPDDPGDWPMVIDVDETFYFKPDAGRILGSPADETPIDPCDVHPEELDVAIGADRIMTAATLDIRHIRNKWAGLRSFVKDKDLVAGFDAAAPGFFWLAGQGGGGIMTSPAMAAIAAALVTGQPIPAHVASFGVTAEALAPTRLR